MGAWGPSLYQNDMGPEIKDEYVMLLKQGKSDEEALQEVYECFSCEMEDDDDRYDICFALADTMWKYGRLTEEVKDKTLRLIKEGGDEKRWEDAKEKEQSKRKEVLKRLKEQLLTDMPPRKKVSVHKPYVTKWKPQEVYLYRIKNPPEGKEKYLGWYIMIYVEGIRGHDFVVRGVMDMTADVYLKLSKEKPNDISDINDATFMCSVRNPDTGIGRFKTTFGETSNRKLPKDLSFIGIFTDFKYPEKEISYKNNIDYVFWHSIERDAILGYENELKRLAETEERN